MTELGAIFVELGLTQYLDAFVEQGFDTWDTILDITESDFDALGVKLGHRRKLQRKIVNSRGLSVERSLASPKRPAASIEGNANGIAEHAALEGSNVQPTATGKRKYRRHPKADEHAPERPPSAYVLFSNKMREELKGRHLSFTEIAKLVGENWQSLAAEGKEPYETQASTAKEKYNAELAEYKKTDMYKKYTEYLADFKAKHSAQPVSDASKRPKLENNPSTGSSDNSSSVNDLHFHESNRLRVGSSGSWNAPTPPAEYGHQPIPGMPGLAISQSRGNGYPVHMNHESGGKTGAPLPGYRDIIIGHNQQQSTLAWRDHTRESMPQLSGGIPRRSSLSTQSQSPLESPVQGGLSISQSNQRRVPGLTPPLLASEMTTSSSGSNGSSQVSGYYGPRTPLEPSLDRIGERTLGIPLYSGKPPGPLEVYPMSESSTSPHNTLNISHHSPTSATAMDYSTLPLRRAYLPPLQHGPISGPLPPPASLSGMSTRGLPTSSQEEPLDPVSALLRAGEIVSSGSRHRHP